MKIAVSSYSFQRLIDAGAMTQLDCVAKAKEMGFDAVEFIDLNPHDGSSAADYAARIREASEKIGIPVSNFTVGADFLKNDPEAEAARVCGLVDVAALLGAASLRHDAAWGWPEGDAHSFEDALPRMADGCRTVTAYAAEKGVKTMVENHGYFCQESTRVETLIRAVNHSNFGWLVDIGNFLCVDENPVDAVRRAAPHAVYAHAKDFYVRAADGPDPGDGFGLKSRGGAHLRGAIVGQGDIRITECLRLLREAGYDGYLGLEYEGIEEPLFGIQTGLDNLRRYLA